MATVVVKRGPRRPAPELPAGELAVQAPPELPRLTGSRWGQLLTVLPMLTGTVATAMMFAGRQGGTYSYIVGGVFGVSSLGMLATGLGSSGGAPKKAERTAARRDYLRHLAGLRRRVKANVAGQRDALHYRHPGPGTLWSTLDSYRLWERRPGDGDFGVARVGIGPQTLATPLVPPVTAPLEELEPMTAGALRRFLDAYSVVPDQPVAVALPSFARLYLRCAEGTAGAAAPAPEQRVRDLVRALVAQLAVFHAPTDLLIAVCASHDRRPEWEYLKWLPHVLHPTRTDRLGPVRLIASSGPELEKLLDDLIGNRPRFGPGTPTAGPQIVCLADGGDLSGCEHLATDGGIAGLTLIDLDGTPPRLLDRATISLTVDEDGTLTSESADGRGEVGVADRLDLPAAEALIQRLRELPTSGLVLSGDREEGALLGTVRPGPLPAGRGWLVTRREGVRLVQLGYLAPD